MTRTGPLGLTVVRPSRHREQNRTLKSPTPFASLKRTRHIRLWQSIGGRRCLDVPSGPKFWLLVIFILPPIPLHRLLRRHLNLCRLVRRRTIRSSWPSRSSVALRRAAQRRLATGIATTSASPCACAPSPHTRPRAPFSPTSHLPQPALGFASADIIFMELGLLVPF